MPISSSLLNKPALVEKLREFYNYVQKNDGKVGNKTRGIDLNFNNACNLRCKYCFTNSPKGDHVKEYLDIDVIKKLADDADELGYFEFDLQGGELLLQPEKLFSVLEAIRPERFYLYLTTNGFYLDEKMAKKLAEYKVSRVSVSIDSMNEKILLEKFEHYKFATLTQLIKLYSVRKKIFSIFGHDSISKPDSITTHTSAHLEKFKSILKLSNKLTKENNSKLYFIYLPKYNRYIDGGNNGQLHSYNKIIKLVQSLDIPVIDINKKLFEKYDDPLSLFSFKMVHYTEKGNQLIAKIIFSKIQEYENIK